MGAWRLLAVAAALIAVLVAGLWQTRPQPGSPAPPAVERRQTQVVRPPGDDVVVFWLDDETPVFVELAK
jgi:FtsZ-interacting cell division protein ZipA